MRNKNTSIYAREQNGEMVVIVYCPLCNCGQVRASHEDADALWKVWQKRATRVATKLIRTWFD